EGYRAGPSLFFIKGKAYVQLLPGEDAKVSGDQMVSLAQAIADSIKDEGGGNWAEQVLPKKDMVAGSFGYQPKNAFNLEFLNDVFSADYEAGSLKLTPFIHQAADPVAARRILDQYAAYIPKQGKIVERPSGESPLLVGDFRGEYDIVFQKGRYVGGATA